MSVATPIQPFREHDSDSDNETAKDPGPYLRSRRGGVISTPIITGYYKYPYWNKHERWALTLIDRLRHSKVFARLTKNEIYALVNAMSTNLFYPGQEIAKQGEVGDAFWAILEGSLDVYRSERGLNRHVSTQVEGAMLEETGVLWNLSRSTSWIAKEQIILAKLAHKDYMNIIVRIDFYRRLSRQAMLREVKLLDMMEDEQIAQLCDCFKVRTYEAGQNIINFGEEGQHFFVLESGEARAWVTNSEGKEIEYTRYYKGSLFGDKALLKNLPRAANITAVVKVEALVLSRAQFERLFGPMSALHQKQNLTDPRKLCADFYMPGDNRGSLGSLILQGLQPDPVRYGKSEWFCVFRPTSNDAIAKMLSGKAVGKGLNIKGKSAKQGKLSGFVPFCQISDNKHKALIEQSPPGSRIRIYYKTLPARAEAKKKLETIMKSTPALKINDRSLYEMTDYTDVFGLEIPEPLLREAYIMLPDLSPVMGYETGRRSEPAFMDMNLHGVRDKSEPTVVLYQYDESDSMNPRGLLIAYAEKMVKPVVSDFDTFLVGSRGVDYEPLPLEQAELISWCLGHTEQILRSPDHNNWTSRWLDVMKKEHEKGFHYTLPKYGFGDPTSIKFTADIVQTTAVCGAVRHGAECFNFGFPQELDDEFLIIWEKFQDVPWSYKNEKSVREFLLERVQDGYAFPLNPCWVVRDKGWIDVLRALKDKAESSRLLDSWFPAKLGLIDRVIRLQTALPDGFIQRAES
eukprot:TRINITY_DN13751_c0_g2_i1.p1 TRINITY_DN13751_c0_g2~~TRINITY_DN13751_c0_g2_i1.p1  ORF type:complete len:742 (+),score=110.74 TRINITY_DN13751_c0_g2_i1:89-2314(+)